MTDDKQVELLGTSNTIILDTVTEGVACMGSLEGVTSPSPPSHKWAKCSRHKDTDTESQLLTNQASGRDHEKAVISYQWKLTRAVEHAFNKLQMPEKLAPQCGQPMQMHNCLDIETMRDGSVAGSDAKE